MFMGEGLPAVDDAVQVRVHEVANQIYVFKVCTTTPPNKTQDIHTRGGKYNTNPPRNYKEKMQTDGNKECGGEEMGTRKSYQV